MWCRFSVRKVSGQVGRQQGLGLELPFVFHVARFKKVMFAERPAPFRFSSRPKDGAEALRGLGTVRTAARIQKVFDYPTYGGSFFRVRVKFGLFMGCRLQSSCSREWFLRFLAVSREVQSTLAYLLRLSQFTLLL